MKTLKIDYVPFGHHAVRTVLHEVAEDIYQKHRHDLASYCTGVCKVAGGRYVRHVVQRDSQAEAA